jgi:hypothetical protein
MAKPLISLEAQMTFFTVKSLMTWEKHVTLNQRVPGSSPGAPTKKIKEATASLNR